MKYTKKLITASLMIIGFVGVSIADNVFIEDVDALKSTHTQEIINYEKTPVMSDYIAQSRKKIKNNWYPPSSSFENTATIIVTLDKEGKLLNCTLATPSEDEGFNDSLIKAVKKTKFSPLPDEFKDDSVNIDFTFNMQKRHIRK